MVTIIAEAGSNHNGSVKTALRLVDLAKDAGADVVKFQFIYPENLYLPKFEELHSSAVNPAFLQREKEVLSNAEWREVWRHASDRGIAATASVFCLQSLDLLADLGADFVKISSTDLVNTEVLSQAAERFNHVLLSTGMSSLGEIERTLASLERFRPDTQLSLLHCVSKYPCALEDSNVSRVEQLRSAFRLDVGYSDHTIGVESSLMALALGATTFEKHITTDRNLAGFDHLHAADSEDFGLYVSSLRAAEKGLTNPPIQQEADAQTRLRARRGIYAAADLPRGHILSREDVLYVRPSTAASLRIEDVLGRELSADIRQYAPLGFETLGEGKSNWLAAKEYWSREMSQKGMTQEIGDGIR